MPHSSAVEPAQPLKQVSVALEGAPCGELALPVLEPRLGRPLPAGAPGSSALSTACPPLAPLPSSMATALPVLAARAAPPVATLRPHSPLVIQGAVPELSTQAPPEHAVGGSVHSLMAEPPGLSPKGEVEPPRAEALGGKHLWHRRPEAHAQGGLSQPAYLRSCRRPEEAPSIWQHTPAPPGPAPPPPPGALVAKVIRRSIISARGPSLSRDRDSSTQSKSGTAVPLEEWRHPTLPSRHLQARQRAGPGVPAPGTNP